MLAQDAIAVLRDSGHEVTAADRHDLDVTSEEAVRDAVEGHHVVLNCAAWTAVDDAESEEATAFAVNAVGAALLARSARVHRARIVQISTDYVFDGEAGEPYHVDAAVRPVSAYGRTKAAGEWAVRAECPEDHLIVRTAWLYGAHGPCFPRTIARLATERASTPVVEDQLGQPTWTRDVAELVERLVVRGVPSGTHHATAGGVASWFDFAVEVCRSAGLPTGGLTRSVSNRFPRPARRPSYSVLAHHSLERLGVTPIGNWRERWMVATDVVLHGGPAVSPLPGAGAGTARSRT